MLRFTAAELSLVTLGLLAVLGCGGEQGRDWQRGQQQPIIVGQDDRREVHELEPTSAQQTVSESVAALMYAHRLQFADENQVVLRAGTLSEALELCDDEAFGEQPAAAYCTGVLVDSDLVLTAGHCMGLDLEAASARCRQSFIVFGYQIAEDDSVAPISGENVYACREVLYHERMSSAEDFLDLALLRLDRAVATGEAPAVFAETPPGVGDELLLASHGAGLPLKVQSGAQVVDTPLAKNYFVAATDSFAGGSGAPLFDAEQKLVGHQVRGEPDWEISGGCRRAAQTDTPNEQHQHLASSLTRLCSEEVGSQRLCNQTFECGDALCSGVEDHESCPEDCNPPHCGDALCEFSEHLTCEPDCAAFQDIPAWWTDEPASYVPSPRPASSGSKSDSGCAIGSGTAAPPELPWSIAPFAVSVALAMRRRTFACTRRAT